MRRACDRAGARGERAHTSCHKRESEKYTPPKREVLFLAKCHFRRVVLIETPRRAPFALFFAPRKCTIVRIGIFRVSARRRERERRGQTTGWEGKRVRDMRDGKSRVRVATFFALLASASPAYDRRRLAPRKTPGTLGLASKRRRRKRGGKERERKRAREREHTKENEETQKRRNGRSKRRANANESDAKHTKRDRDRQADRRRQRGAERARIRGFARHVITGTRREQHRMEPGKARESTREAVVNDESRCS